VIRSDQISAASYHPLVVSPRAGYRPLIVLGRFVEKSVSLGCSEADERRHVRATHTLMSMRETQARSIDFHRGDGTSKPVELVNDWSVRSVQR
jgi:hypothetical protein